MTVSSILLVCTKRHPTKPHKIETFDRVTTGDDIADRYDRWAPRFAEYTSDLPYFGHLESIVSMVLDADERGGHRRYRFCCKLCGRPVARRGDLLDEILDRAADAGVERLDLSDLATMSPK